MLLLGLFLAGDGPFVLAGPVAWHFAVPGVTTLAVLGLALTVAAIRHNANAPLPRAQ